MHYLLVAIDVHNVGNQLSYHLTFTVRLSTVVSDILSEQKEVKSLRLGNMR